MNTSIMGALGEDNKSLPLVFESSFINIARRIELFGTVARWRNSFSLGCSGLATVTWYPSLETIIYGLCDVMYYVYCLIL